MIAVKDIMAEVRYKEHDNNEVRFSDYDIIKCLNEALRYINRSFSLKNTDFLEKVEEYRLADINAEITAENEELEEGEEAKPLMRYRDGFTLPSDLLSIVSVVAARSRYPLHPCNAGKTPNHMEYKVINGKIYTREDIDLLYRYSLEAVTAEDTVDFPPAFLDILAKLTGMILNNNPQEDVMAEANKSLAEALIPARRFANRRVYPVWKV